MTKKSWIQKIREYDNLERDCEFKALLLRTDRILFDDLRKRLLATEQMRDHNREIADAWRERAATQEALATVWEGVATEACKRSRVIDRRLKFSVGHNHIEIIIGNPVTACENYNAKTEDEDGRNTETAYTICSPKDKYNWKTGAIKALENLCRDWGYERQLTGYLFAEMKKKYPEVFEK